jgi:hypothetical protein
MQRLGIGSEDKRKEREKGTFRVQGCVSLLDMLANAWHCNEQR